MCCTTVSTTPIWAPTTTPAATTQTPARTGSYTTYANWATTPNSYPWPPDQHDPPHPGYAGILHAAHPPLEFRLRPRAPATADPGVFQCERHRRREGPH